MTNKFKRSVTAVLLAVAMVLSSQGVIAFADYGTNSDVSELPPVQEDELTVGESGSAPMAAPMMMSAPMGHGHNDPKEPTSAEIEALAPYIRIDYECETMDKLHDDDLLEDKHDDDTSFKLSDFEYGTDYKVVWPATDDGKAEWDEAEIVVINSDAFVAAYNKVHSKDFSTHTYQGFDSVDLKWKDNHWRIERDDDGSYDDLDIKLVCDGEQENKPTAPNYNTLNQLIQVQVQCVTENSGHQIETIGLLEGEYSVPENWTDDQTTYTVTITPGHAEKYVEKYDFQLNFDEGTHTSQVTENKQVTLTWTPENDWTGPSDPIIIDAKCTPEIPETPKIDVVALGLGVKFDCNTENGHDSSDPVALTKEGNGTYYNISPVEGTTATVTIIAGKYLEDYNDGKDTIHRLQDENAQYTIQLENVDGSWRVNNESSATVTIPVTCKEKAEKITEVEVVLGKNLNPPHPVNEYLSIHAHYGQGEDYIKLPNIFGSFFIYDPHGVAGLTTKVNSIEEAQKFFTGFALLRHGENDWISNSQISKVEVTNIIGGLGKKLTITLDGNKTDKPDKPTSEELGNILGNVTVQCTTANSGHNYKDFTFKDVENDNIDGLYYSVTEPTEDNQVTVTVNYDPYVERYSNYYTFPSKTHSRVSPEAETATFTLKWENDTWKAIGPVPEKGIVIGVQCEIPTPGPEAVADIDVQLDCLNNPSHSQDKVDLEWIVTPENYYTVKQDANDPTKATVSITPAQASRWVTDTNAPEKPVHVWVGNELSTIDLKYDNGWTLANPENNTITISMLCAPTEAEVRNMGLGLTLECVTEQNKHEKETFNLSDSNVKFQIMPSPMPLSDDETPFVYVIVDKADCLAQYNATHSTHTYAANNPEAIFVLEWSENPPMAARSHYSWQLVSPTSLKLDVEHEVTNPPVDPTDPGTNPGGNTGNNDDDDDNDVEVSNFPRIRLPGTTTIDDEDVPLADLPTDDTVTIDDGEVPLKDNPETGDALPVAALAAAALSLGGVVVLNRKKK